MPDAETQQRIEELVILHYPDPRLRERCAPVTEFDGRLEPLTERMFALMKEAKGVGLAASQVGVLQRVFVMNLTGEEKDKLVFVNPVLRDREGNVETEEGCLSLPGINVHIRRSKRCRIQAQDLRGQPFELAGEDLVCRCWQHEIDHLDGVLLMDRMGPADRIATRGILRALEQGYHGPR